VGTLGYEKASELATRARLSGRTLRALAVAEA